MILKNDRMLQEKFGAAKGRLGKNKPI